ncbi:hypothetical protein MACK_002534 [Theileria orientalis]|uniref:RING-type E3 ubiquitin transferase n=1 Tax=Theileria orientalis TaxID=68886 RepID=A0A976MDL3_THEOR|nr:hypothetical protein MACK_002534 [Theileria orientalis]
MQGNLNSNHLLNNMEENNRRRSRRFPLAFPTLRQRSFSGEAQGETEAGPDRSVEICLCVALVLVVTLMLGLNFVQTSDQQTSPGDPVIFSTYYTSKYNLCLTYEDKNAVNAAEVGGREKECIDGDVDITLLYKDVTLEGYYRVYAVFSFELDYQGKWYVPWKKKHFFSSKNKDKRLVIGLSNLIYQGSMKPNNTEAALENVWDYLYINKLNAEKNSKDNSVDETNGSNIKGSDVGDSVNKSTDTTSNVTSVTGDNTRGAGVGSNSVDSPVNNSVDNSVGSSNTDVRKYGGTITGTRGLLLDTTDDSDNESKDDESKDRLEEEYKQQLRKQLQQLLNSEFGDDDDYEDGERDIEGLTGGGTGSDMELIFMSGEDNENDTTEGVTLYLNSFVPNFINVKNVSSKLFKGLIKGDSTYNIYNEGISLLNSIRLNTWNEFSNQFNVYNYNLQLNLNDNPLEYYLESQRRAARTNRGRIKSGSDKKNNRAKSFRRLDDFYLLNLRKFVQNEYHHISNFDTSVLNIFNVFKTRNPYRYFFKKKGKELEGTSSKTKMEETKHISDDEDVKLDQETLNKYFQPIDWNATQSETVVDNATTVKSVTSNNDADKVTTIRIGGNSDAANIANGSEGKEAASGTGGDSGSGVGGEESDSSASSGTTRGSGEMDIEGSMWCNDMNVDLTFKGKEKNFKTLKTSENLFSILFLVKSLTEIGLLFQQFEVVDSAAQGRTVSLMTLSLLSFQDVLDLFLLLYHSNAFIDVSLVYMLMVILKAAIICLIYQNLIVLVWRASHTYHIRRGWVETQKSFLSFYKYYLTFTGIGVTILYYYYEAFPFLIVLPFGSWVPQILLDVWRGQNNSLSMVFIFFSSLLKMFFPIYLFFTPTNVFTVDKFSSDYLGHDRKLVYIITFITSVQLILISIQRLKGPRCFVSWSILPKIYSYVRPWSKIMQDDDQECVICMYDIVQSNRDWCLTPCDHLFHTKCLKDWTSIKLECPNCRRPIPPITE